MKKEWYRFVEVLTPLYVGFLFGLLATGTLATGNWFVAYLAVFFVVAFASRWASDRREQLLLDQFRKEYLGKFAAFSGTLPLGQSHTEKHTTRH